MIAGPELSRVVNEFEDTLCNISASSRHHDQVPHVQMTFAKDVMSLIATFEELGIHFLSAVRNLLYLTLRSLWMIRL